MMRDRDDCRSTAEPFHKPSKTQRKRQATAVQQLGEHLVGLTPHQLTKLPLTSKLRDAVLAAQTISQRGARKRQLQYIGKLMRHVDPEPIQAALAALAVRRHPEVRQQGQYERLCDALITGDAVSFQHLLDRHPHIESRRLRQLIRQAAREQTQDQHGRCRRALLRYLKALEDA
jgi:ribosome-associated protein